MLPKPLVAAKSIRRPSERRRKPNRQEILLSIRAGRPLRGRTGPYAPNGKSKAVIRKSTEKFRYRNERI